MVFWGVSLLTSTLKPELRVCKYSQNTVPLRCPAGRYWMWSRSPPRLSRKLGESATSRDVTTSTSPPPESETQTTTLTDAAGRRPNLNVPTQEEVKGEWGPKLAVEQRIHRKTQRVHAKVAKDDGILEKIVEGVCEERTRYDQGDYIMVGSRGGRCTFRSLHCLSN